jgi:hypothetical protein
MATNVPRGPANMSDPAIGAVAISYGGGDQDLSAYPVRGIHCNTAGDFKVDMVDGTTVTITCIAGVVYPYRIKTVYQTGSTAAGVIVY